MEGRYSPIRPRLAVAATFVTPAISPRTWWSPIWLSAVAVHIRIRLRSVAARWWRSSVAVIWVAAAGWCCVVIHGWSATWWPIALLPWIFVVAAWWWGAATIVIATWAVPAWWAAAVVVVLTTRWRTVPTAAVAWRARPVSLAWTRDVGLGLIIAQLALLTLANTVWTYIRDAANRGVLEGVVVELLHCGGKVCCRLVLDKALQVSVVREAWKCQYAYPLPMPFGSRSRLTSLYTTSSPDWRAKSFRSCVPVVSPVQPKIHSQGEGDLGQPLPEQTQIARQVSRDGV